MDLQRHVNEAIARFNGTALVEAGLSSAREIKDLIKAGRRSPRDRGIIGRLASLLLRSMDRRKIFEMLVSKDTLFALRLFAGGPRLFEAVARDKPKMLKRAFEGIVRRGVALELKGLDHLSKVARKAGTHASAVMKATDNLRKSLASIERLKGKYWDDYLNSGGSPAEWAGFDAESREEVLLDLEDREQEGFRIWVDQMDADPEEWGYLSYSEKEAVLRRHDMMNDPGNYDDPY